MPLNKSTGNMYPWVTHTWNVLKGQCPHDCIYCYMKKWGEQPPLRFHNKELRTDLGTGNTIFVGSSCDMWAETIPKGFINAILDRCREYPKNGYLFQTKNPARFNEFLDYLPYRTILGVTIESNRCSNVCRGGPCENARYQVMKSLARPKMVSIEPVMDFDLDVFLKMLLEINPEFVSIGANTSNVQLPEPEPVKLKALIEVSIP